MPSSNLPQSNQAPGKVKADNKRLYSRAPVVETVTPLLSTNVVTETGERYTWKITVCHTSITNEEVIVADKHMSPDGPLVPQNEGKRAFLIIRFREEILQDETDRFVFARGGTNPIDAHELAAIEMVEALRTGGELIGLGDNITRRDWDRSGNCVDTFLINGTRYRGTGESASPALHGSTGRTDLPPASSFEAFMDNHGPDGFYRMIMWPLLP